MNLCTRPISNEYKVMKIDGQPTLYYEIDVRLKENIFSVIVFVNTCEWLKQVFEEDEITKKFNKLNKEGEGCQDIFDYYCISNEAKEYLDSLGPVEVFTNYTYNRSSLLSHDVQFTLVEINGGYYIIFKVHNGKDARCGFSETYMLRVPVESNDPGNAKSYVIMALDPLINLYTNKGVITMNGAEMVDENSNELNDTDLAGIEIKGYFIEEINF